MARAIASLIAAPSTNPSAEKNPTRVPRPNRPRACSSPMVAPAKQPSTAPTIEPSRGTGTKARKNMPSRPPISPPHAAWRLAPILRAVRKVMANSATSPASAAPARTPRITTPGRYQSDHHACPSADARISHVPGSLTAVSNTPMRLHNATMMNAATSGTTATPRLSSGGGWFSIRPPTFQIRGFRARKQDRDAQPSAVPTSGRRALDGRAGRAIESDADSGSATPRGPGRVEPSRRSGGI